MNPYDEQGLRDEVIYLHSLWRQGPPSHPPPNPIHLPIRRTLHNSNTIPSSSSSSQPHYIPQPFRPHFHAHPRHLRPHQQQHHTIHPFAPTHTRSLPPVTSTAFKKKNKKKKNKKKETRPDPLPQSPGIEWPCPASPDPPQTGWLALKPHSDPPPPPPPAVSPQEKERLSSLQAQNKACQAFREFLVDSKDGDDSGGGGDGDDDDDDGDNGEDDDDDDDGLEEFEEFFVGVFMEDNELRKYYQKCFESGKFCCLVCGAVEKKKSAKKFKDCAGLVQHSMSILRSANKRAHRAFGKAVCKVLGWDIDRFPTIVMKGEPLGCSAEMKPDEAEGEPEKLA